MQIVRLFTEHLEGEDPFFIPGQEDVKLANRQAYRDKQKQDFTSNFIETDVIDDIEKYEDEQRQNKAEPLKMKYRKFHEIDISQRIAIILYMAQSKLDADVIAPEFTEALQTPVP